MEQSNERPEISLDELIQKGINKFARVNNGITPAVLEDIARYLLDPNTFIRMQVATELGRPAVEPLAAHLEKVFSVTHHKDWESTRQFIGFIVRGVMEKHNYEVEKGGCKVSSKQSVFNRATRYRLRSATSEGQVPSPIQVVAMPGDLP